MVRNLLATDCVAVVGCASISHGPVGDVKMIELKAAVNLTIVRSRFSRPDKLSVRCLSLPMNPVWHFATPAWLWRLSEMRPSWYPQYFFSHGMGLRFAHVYRL